MPEYTYEAIEFYIFVREGFYRYQQKVSPVYLVMDSDAYQRYPDTFENDWYMEHICVGNNL